MKPTILIGLITVSMVIAVTMSGATQDPEGTPSLVILYTSDTNGQFEACD